MSHIVFYDHFSNQMTPTSLRYQRVNSTLHTPRSKDHFVAEIAPVQGKHI